MEIALSPIVIFFLLLPGITFSRFYFTEEFSKQYIKSNFFEVFFVAFIPALFLHFIGWLFFGAFCFDLINFQVLGGFFWDEKVTSSIVNFGQNFHWILLYIITLCILGSLMGTIAYRYVRANKLDIKFKLFRYKNHWHYILTGEILEFPRFNFAENIEADDIDIKYIDALVDTGEGLVLYKGILGDYELSMDGGLNLLYLIGAKKRLFNKKATRFTPIKGEIFILKYSNLINLNITYYRLINEDNQV